MLRRQLALLCALAAIAGAAETPPALPESVAVAPTKTSIYIGTVSLTMPVFTRSSGGFESSYTARVFPYFFFSESGTLRVEVSDEQLGRLIAGTPIEFSGRAVRSDGAVRSVTGRAAPDDADSGRLKVRVSVTRRIELVFDTTYEFHPQ